MNKFTIQQLQQMRESEDCVEFKAGDSQRHTDEVTLRKLIDEGLLISTQDGYKLSDRYYEIAKNTAVDVIGQDSDTVNVQLSNAIELTERQNIIYNSIKESVQLNVRICS